MKKHDDHDAFFKKDISGICDGKMERRYQWIYGRVCGVSNTILLSPVDD
jgi:hypothetical protein